jgi:hypothetical protein
VRWTALDRLGSLARFDGTSAVIAGRAYVTEGTPYVPVAAFDPDTGITLVAYRDAFIDDVRYIDNTGAQGIIGAMTVGKWPVAIRRVGPGKFDVVWISSRQLTTVTIARFIRAGATWSITHSERTIDPAAVLMEFDAAGGLRLDNIDSGYDFRTFTRAGVAIRLIYWTELNGRVVGVDGREGAPNQALLGDSDGWYLVSDNNNSALFPPRLDVNGNVATFEGDYFTIDDIRSRVIAHDPNAPRIQTFNVTPQSAGGPEPEIFLLLLGLVLAYVMLDS